MATIVTRAGKGSALTYEEMDANFTNLNDDKLEVGVTATDIVNTPAGSILATDVQAAINELDTEKEPADATILKEADIGTTVQGYDADTAKTDVAQSYTALQTFPDSNFEIVDNADATKKLVLEVSGITTATTRTATWPDKDGTVAMVSDIGNGTVRSTPVSLNGLTEVIQTDIPEWANEVILAFYQVSTTATVQPLVQIGSASLMNDGSYEAIIGLVASTPAMFSANNGLPISTSTATYTMSGVVSIVKRGETASATDCVLSLSGYATNGSVLLTLTGGAIGSATSGKLSRVRVSVASGTFDSGTVTFIWR
jgi:hypothetical protein